MSEANFNVNLPSSESDDDMSTSMGITEKELVVIENEVIPEATRRSAKYGMKKIVDWYMDKKINLDCGQISVTGLNEHLRKFYGELNHGNKGKSLSSCTLNVIRALILRKNYIAINYQPTLKIFYQSR